MNKEKYYLIDNLISYFDFYLGWSFKWICTKFFCFLWAFQEVSAVKFNVLVTTYEFIMYDRSKLSKIDWKYIIIDEAQRMKDRESVLARDLDRYRCQRRLLLTGTPLQVCLWQLKFWGIKRKLICICESWKIGCLLFVLFCSFCWDVCKIIFTSMWHYGLCCLSV